MSDAPADTQTVSLTVLGVERVAGRGSLIALAIAELDVCGVLLPPELADALAREVVDRLRGPPAALTPPVAA